MPTLSKAIEVVEAVLTAFQAPNERPTPEEVEELMRPFAPISYTV